MSSCSLELVVEEDAGDNGKSVMISSVENINFCESHFIRLVSHGIFTIFFVSKSALSSFGNDMKVFDEHCSGALTTATFVHRGFVGDEESLYDFLLRLPLCLWDDDFIMR